MGSAAFIPTFENAAYGILNFFGDIWTFVRDVAIINRNANYNSVYLLKKGVNHSDITKDNNGQDTDKAVRILRLGGSAYNGSGAGSGGFDSNWVRSASHATVGFFTTVKLD